MPTAEQYITTLPEGVPEGKALVHNHVRPTHRLGSRGFRAWLAESSSELTVCHCGHFPEYKEHYVVLRPGRAPLW
jgi:hypothetical protein